MLPFSMAKIAWPAETASNCQYVCGVTVSVMSSPFSPARMKLTFGHCDRCTCELTALKPARTDFQTSDARKSELVPLSTMALVIAVCLNLVGKGAAATGAALPTWTALRFTL